jgi:hypothetical protein
VPFIQEKQNKISWYKCLPIPANLEITSQQIWDWNILRITPNTIDLEIVPFCALTKWCIIDPISSRPQKRVNSDTPNMERGTISFDFVEKIPSLPNLVRTSLYCKNLLSISNFPLISSHFRWVFDLDLDLWFYHGGKVLTCLYIWDNQPDSILIVLYNHLSSSVGINRSKVVFPITFRYKNYKITSNLISSEGCAWLKEEPLIRMGVCNWYNSSSHLHLISQMTWLILLSCRSSLLYHSICSSNFARAITVIGSDEGRNSHTHSLLKNQINPFLWAESYWPIGNNHHAVLALNPLRTGVTKIRMQKIFYDFIETP